MRLVEIQDEMHRLVDEAEREIEAIKRTIAANQALTDRSSKPAIGRIEPVPEETTLPQRLKLLAAS